MSEVLERVKEWLRSSGVAFVEKHHEPTFTSEESAKARGEPLRIGAKALVVKADDVFRLLVLPADRRLDSAAVKRQFAAKKLRFANAAELLTLTGLVPGSVPPLRPADPGTTAHRRPGSVGQRKNRLQRRLADRLDHHGSRRLRTGCGGRMGSPVYGNRLKRRNSTDLAVDIERILAVASIPILATPVGSSSDFPAELVSRLLVR